MIWRVQDSVFQGRVQLDLPGQRIDYRHARMHLSECRVGGALQKCGSDEIIQHPRIFICVHAAGQGPIDLRQAE